MCVSVSEDDVTSSLYSELLEVSLNSARKNTSLDIIILYDGPDKHIYMDVMNKYNVKIIRWKFSHFEALKKTFTAEYLKKTFNKNAIDYNKIAGTFMRFDIPFIEMDDEYVLYSDIDVIFNKEIRLDSFNKTKVIAAGPETDKDFADGNIFNAGILFFNVKEMRKHVNTIFNKLENGIIPKVSLFDQGYINEVCKSDIELLPLEFNWKPYWGHNDDAYIIHFHGIKPGGDNSASGFNMSDAFFYHVFRDKNLAAISGYLKYFKDYFNYLGKNNDKWIRQHTRKILKLLFPENKLLRRIISSKMKCYLVYNNFSNFLFKLFFFGR
ncbi:glycosyltransferase [Succinivibrio dextrinosolvens]|nr:glycosyltransferase [Succinivibrio dextrinosolvens]